MTQTKILLASSSPRRKQLLSKAGWSFSTFPVQVNEMPLKEEAPIDFVKRMAMEKMNVALESINLAKSLIEIKDVDALCVITADTVVVDGNEILGKPRDDAEAVAMLSRLRSRIHEVISALAVAYLEKKQNTHPLWSLTHPIEKETCLTQVVMRDYTDEEIITYVASGDAYDKAGAYAIQNKDFNPVASIKGCFANVMGLPMCMLAPILLGFHIEPNDINKVFVKTCLHNASKQPNLKNDCRSIWVEDSENEVIR